MSAGSDAGAAARATNSTPGGHDLSGDGVAERLAPVLDRALSGFGISPGSEARLVNVSENATYLVDDVVTGERSVLRVHRHGYHDRTAIESELAWLDAVRTEAGVRTPRVLSAPDGTQVLELREDGRPEPRHVVRCPPRRVDHLVAQSGRIDGDRRRADPADDVGGQL